jgi:hypothetical protein
MKTAVEFLIDEIIKLTGVNIQMDEPIIEQAKQMEKEHIMRTAWHCHIEGVEQGSKTSQEYIQYAEQYYNETFKSEE